MQAITGEEEARAVTNADAGLAHAMTAGSSGAAATPPPPPSACEEASDGPAALCCSPGCGHGGGAGLDLPGPEVLWRELRLLREAQAATALELAAVKKDIAGCKLELSHTQEALAAALAKQAQDRGAHSEQLRTLQDRLRAALSTPGPLHGGRDLHHHYQKNHHQQQQQQVADGTPTRVSELSGACPGPASLLIGLASGKIAVSRLSDGAVGRCLPHSHGSEVMGIVSTGAGRFVSASHDGTVLSWASLKQVHRRWNALQDNNLPDKRAPLAMRWGLGSGNSSKDAGRGRGRGGLNFLMALQGAEGVVTCGDQGHLRVWSIDGSLRHSLEGHSPGCSVNKCVALSDGRVASAASDGTVKVWRLEPRVKAVLDLRGHNGPVNQLVALRDGRLLSAAEDGTMRMWRLTDGACDRTIRTDVTHHVDAMVELDGGRMLTSSDGGRLRIWSLSTGEHEGTLEGEPALVMDLRVLPSGAIASVAMDNTLRLWASNGTRDRVVHLGAHMPLVVCPWP